MSDEALQNLKKLVEEYRKYLYEVQNKIKIIEEGPLAEALVGQCFKYRNSYGNGNKGWWLYRRIVKVHNNTDLLIETFQEAQYGKIEFEKNVHAYVYQFKSDVPIPLKEYLAAEKRLLNKMMKEHKKKGKK